MHVPSISNIFPQIYCPNIQILNLIIPKAFPNKGHFNTLCCLFSQYKCFSKRPNLIFTYKFKFNKLHKLYPKSDPSLISRGCEVINKVLKFKIFQHSPVAICKI